MPRVESKQGLTLLLKRYIGVKADQEWINTIQGCINENLAMDEIDYQNTPKNLRPLWKGLR